MPEKRLRRINSRLIVLASLLLLTPSLSSCVARSAEKQEEVRRISGQPGADLNAEFKRQTGEDSPSWDWIMIPMDDYLAR